MTRHDPLGGRGAGLVPLHPADDWRSGAGRAAARDAAFLGPDSTADDDGRGLIALLAGLIIGTLFGALGAAAAYWWLS